MFKFSELKTIQIEITSRCQASCPMCLRNIHGGIENPNLKINDWTLDNFKKIFTKEVLAQLEKIIFCGDFGEPTLNNDLIGMCSYLKTESPNITVSLMTNGSARNINWWKEFAKSLPEKHNVEFALDGLEDTQHLYRIGTNYTKIIENAKAFILEGGIAEWVFIKFKHNQHQVDRAQYICRKLGFKKFTLKNSKRFNGDYKVLDKNGEVSHILSQPDSSPISFINKKELKNFASWRNADRINCFVKEKKEIYIDAQYNVYPCCLLGSFPYSYYNSELYEKYQLHEDLDVVTAGKIAQDETFRIINDLGGPDKLNAVTNGIKNIIEDDKWQTLWEIEWKNKTSPVCIILCSESTTFTKIEDQIEK